MLEKYYKYDKIRLNAQSENGLVRLINDADLKVLKYAQKCGFTQLLNDSPNRDDLGYFFLVKRFFEFKRMKSSMYADISRKSRHLKKIKSLLKREKLYEFFTSSHIGYFVVNNKQYSNFHGVGDNSILVFKCDFNEFKNTQIITPRQIYNTNKPITILKFDELKTIQIALSDEADCTDFKIIKNVCGFCIWKRSMLVFVTE